MSSKWTSELARPGVEIVNLGLIDTPQSRSTPGTDFARRRGHHFPPRHDLRPLLDRAAGGAPGRVPVIVLNLQPAAAIDYAAFNRMGDRTAHDRRVAGVLRRLPRAGDRQRLRPLPASPSTKSPACSTTIRPAGTRWTRGSRPPGSPHVMAHNRLGVDGPLLRRHARYLLRSHPAVRHLRRPHRNRSRWTNWPPSAARSRPAQIKARVAEFQRAFDVQPDCSGRRTGARRPHVRGAGPAGRRGTTSVRWPTTTWAPATPANEDAISSIILGNSLLTARGVPVAGE